MATRSSSRAEDRQCRVDVIARSSMMRPRYAGPSVKSVLSRRSTTCEESPAEPMYCTVYLAASNPSASTSLFGLRRLRRE
jgi:hypothetical protein